MEAATVSAGKSRRAIEQAVAAIRAGGSAEAERILHRNSRAVRSASSEQVRRPINRDGVEYWRQYQRWLGPLEQALGDALGRWDKV